MRTFITKNDMIVECGIVYFAVVTLIAICYLGNGIEAIGCWLAGTLTPAALTISIWTFQTMEAARIEQASAQARLAEIAENSRLEQAISQRIMAQINQRTAFIAQKDTLERHLSYLGSCILTRKRLAHDEHRALMEHRWPNAATGNGGYERLWWLLVRKRNNEINEAELPEFDKLYSGDTKFFLKEFQNDLLDIMKIGYEAGIPTHFDRRLREIPELFYQFGLWQFDPIQVVNQPRETLESVLAALANGTATLPRST